MVILYSEKFKESVEPFRIYMLMLPARVAYFGLLFQGAGKTGLVLFRAIITLFLNAIITYFLVLKFGIGSKSSFLSNPYLIKPSKLMRKGF